MCSSEMRVWAAKPDRIRFLAHWQQSIPLNCFNVHIRMDSRRKSTPRLSEHILGNTGPMHVASFVNNSLLPVSVFRLGRGPFSVHYIESADLENPQAGRPLPTQFSESGDSVLAGIAESDQNGLSVTRYFSRFKQSASLQKN